ncbi:AbrB/MazE/SpoVT family DNA-binding domain-containing protein [Candidatus Parcubacteria bacterium]|nr:AbrB/MazE/SpoVT family DNA-binding domain-containing protein [Candidatus Parcubacteria bacterium]
MRKKVLDAKNYKYKHIHYLSKAGGHSYYIVLPVDFVRELNWRERQKLVINKTGNKITIEDWEK